MGQWHTAEEYDGQVREITFRSLCNSPMCPPDTAMTEWQHVVLSPDKKNLVRLLLVFNYYYYDCTFKKNNDNDDIIMSISFMIWIATHVLLPPPKKKSLFSEFKISDGMLWLLLGVWDCAAGTWCSIWVLFWGMEYFGFLIWILSCYCYFLFLIYFVPEIWFGSFHLYIIFYFLLFINLIDAHMIYVVKKTHNCQGVKGLHVIHCHSRVSLLVNYMLLLIVNLNLKLF